MSSDDTPEPPEDDGADAPGDEPDAVQETDLERAQREEADLERLTQENARLREQLADEHLDKSRKRRRRASIALAVVVALLLPPSVITVWTRNRMLNTDIYVDTVAPLAQDPVIKSALATRLSAEIVKAVDLKKLAEEVLPEKAQPLSGFIAAGGDNLIGQLTTRAIDSKQFEEIWVAANREAHKKLVAILTGGEGTVLDFENGEVTVSLKKLADTVLGRLKDVTGIDIEGRIPEGVLNSDFVLFKSAELARIQSAVKLFNRVAWGLVVVTLASLVGAVLLAEKLRLGVRRAGIALAVSTALTLIAIALGREFYLNALAGKVQSPAAAGQAFDIIINFMRVTLRSFLALGVVLMVGAWAVGPSHAAVRVRSWGQALLGAADARTGGHDLGPVPRFVHTYEHPLEWGVAGIGVIVLIAWNRPTGLTVLVVALLCALAFGLIRLLGAVSRPSADVGGGAGGGEPPAAVAADGVVDDGIEQG